MNDEKSELQELAARIEALEDRLGVVEDVCRLLVQKAQELETCIVSLHERTATCELAVERARDLMRLMSEGLEALLRRAAGGKPPGPAAPLSGVN
jgi:uncharacterized coiled-coil protein SlyX